MKQFILTQFPWTWMPIVALLIFFTFFVGLLIRLSMKSQQPVLEQASMIPLEDPGLEHGHQRSQKHSQNKNPTNSTALKGRRHE